MRAAFIEEYGGPGSVRAGHFPEPVAGPQDAVIRVRAASLNHHDVYTTRGEAGRFELPLVLGSDGVGDVVQAPAGAEVSKGARVAIFPVIHCGGCEPCRRGEEHKCFSFGMVGGERQGTMAEYVALPARNCVPLPPGLPDSVSAGLGVAGLTAWNMVVDEGKIQAGEHVLLLGATGGVGVYTIHLLKHLGAVVYAVTSKPEKVEWLAACGADHVFTGGAASVLVTTSRLPHQGVDAAINYVGGHTWRYVLPAVRRGGRILTCGAVGGAVAELDQRQIFYRQLRIIGCSMGSRCALQRLAELMASRAEWTIPLCREGSLDDVRDALEQMERREVSGKIVIHP